MPGAEAGAADRALLAKLRALIRRDGPLRIDRYMAACLADPEHGYWRKASIGADGDFITAPEISQTFGELIGLWCAVVWQSLGSPARVRLIELGPGRGTLMRDALRAAARVPEFRAALSVHLVEISEPLREAQRRSLAPPVHDGERPPIAWHEALADVPEGPAIIVANEFLDALPVRQAVFHEGAWRERVVDVDAHGALRFTLGPVAVAMESGLAATPKAGEMVEVRPGEGELLAQIARRASPTVALFIDYGPAEDAYGDTLQAVRRHRYVDPLGDPGHADLTAHVQFARLARQAHAAGLAADGPMLQAEFLARLGIAERGARLMAANPGRAGDIEAAVQRVISPTGMGQLFKVMAVRTRELPPPPPFG